MGWRRCWSAWWCWGSWRTAAGRRTRRSAPRTWPRWPGRGDACGASALFEPAVIDRARPAPLETAAYLELGERAAVRVAAANGVPAAAVRFLDGNTFAPVRIRVELRDRIELAGRSVRLRAVAEAELGPGPGGAVTFRDGYDGPLAMRQGKPMRRDVAMAFDRMAAAARPTAWR